MTNLARTTAIIELHVPDFEKVKSFYADLDFKVLWGYPPKEKGGYLMMQLEENMIGFYCGNEEVYNQEYFKKFPKDTPRGYGTELGLIITTSIDEYYAKVKKLHPNSIVGELKMKPWGWKDFRIVDPFGFYIRFSEPNDMSKP